MPLPGFSTLVEPCATAIWASSGESFDAGAYPGERVFADPALVRSVAGDAAIATPTATPTTIAPAAASLTFLEIFIVPPSRAPAPPAPLPPRLGAAAPAMGIGAVTAR